MVGVVWDEGVSKATHSLTSCLTGEEVLVYFLLVIWVSHLDWQ